VYNPPTVSVEDILAPLKAKVSRDKGIAKFNIRHNHIWEGARHSFLHATYYAVCHISQVY